MGLMTFPYVTFPYVKANLNSQMSLNPQCLLSWAGKIGELLKMPDNHLR
jgi:hypothetical protein